MLAGDADIRHVSKILLRNGLHFWANIFDEYLDLFRLLDLDGAKDFTNKGHTILSKRVSAKKWVNHRIIGSNLSNILVRRNRNKESSSFKNRLNININEPSSRNRHTWFFLERSFFKLGSFINSNGATLGSTYGDFNTPAITTSVR